MPLLRPRRAAVRWLLPLALPLLAPLGCGDGDDYPIGPPGAVFPTPSAILAVPGDTVRLRFVDDRGRAVTASVLGVASPIATIDPAGLVTAVSAGLTVVNVTASVNGQIVTTTVPVAILGLTLDPPRVTMAAAATVTLRPTFVGDSARYGTLRWTSSDTTVATVDAGGTVRGVRGGIVRVAATSSAYPTVRAESEITIADPHPTISALTVLPDALTLQFGGTVQLTATVQVAPGAPASVSRGVAFTSRDTTIATVSTDGLVTGRRDGTTTIRVHAVAAPTVWADVPVTVRDRGPLRLTIQSITTLGDPPTPVDLNAVHGAIRVTVNLLYEQAQRAELWLDGALAAVREDLPRAGTGGLTTVALDVDTSVREPASGARRYPNGPTTLVVRLTHGPNGSQVAAIQQPIVLANP